MTSEKKRKEKYKGDVLQNDKKLNKGNKREYFNNFDNFNEEFESIDNTPEVETPEAQSDESASYYDL